MVGKHKKFCHKGKFYNSNWHNIIFLIKPSELLIPMYFYPCFLSCGSNGLAKFLTASSPSCRAGSSMAPPSSVTSAGNLCRTVVWQRAEQTRQSWHHTHFAASGKYFKRLISLTSPLCQQTSSESKCGNNNIHWRIVFRELHQGKYDRLHEGSPSSL